MPVLCSNCLLVCGDGLWNFTETFDAMWQERDSFRRGINEPSQNYFGCSPSGTTLLHPFDRRRFLPKGSICIVEGAKHLIEQAEKDAFDPLAGPLVALQGTAKIVYVDIPLS